MTGCTARYHDTASAYTKHGCRCETARTARRNYEKRRIAGLLEPGFVPALGAQRRIHALCAIGWPVRTQLVMLGYGPKSMQSQLLHGERIHRTVHERVARLYDRLHMTLGPSRMSRVRAVNRGWAPPLAWDPWTIDDPGAKPSRALRDRALIDEVVIERLMYGDPTVSTRIERLEATRRMTAAGRSAAEIAAALDRSEVQIVRYRKELRAALPSPTAVSA